MSETAIILLAAGNSTRMGVAKQLLEFHGEPLLRRAVSVAQSSGCRPVVVVLGAREQEMRMLLADLSVEIVVNERWPEGMGTSIQTGLSALEGRDVNGAILALADQPFVTPEFLRGLAGKHAGTGKSIVASRYSETAGVPAFFARSAFPHLLALKPNQGCKGVILGNPADSLLVDCPEAAIDIDTPGDYARAVGGLSRP